MDAFSAVVPAKMGTKTPDFGFAADGDGLR
jgi:hypothetical protein